MKKCLALLFLIFAAVLYAQEVPVEQGSLLSTGGKAAMNLEATTGFVWDIENNATGLETKAGIELKFPLFANANRGVYPDNTDNPAVRLALTNMAFSWWNVYNTRGGNYEQDDFNNWQNRPLVLTFDDFSADVVWKNYFFRIASSTTVFQTTQAILFSIFDEVMDAGSTWFPASSKRWYYRRSQTRALWHTERYNIQQLPLLRNRITRDFVDEDYRAIRTHMTGMLAAGGEFDSFSFAVKAASRYSGRPIFDPALPANTENAWLFGADFEFTPVDNLKIDLTGFAGINYEKTDVGKNPANAGLSIEYRIPLSDRYILTPKAGFDFAMDTSTNENVWEAGAGLLFFTRGFDYLSSSRILDWDNVIPIGASASVNVNNEMLMNVMVSWFEPAGRDSFIPNFGGFLQFELSDLLGNGRGMDYGVLAQLEYLIAEKFMPYVRGGYRPLFQENDGHHTNVTGDYMIKAMAGCFLIPFNFFSIDIRYELNIVGSDIFSSQFGAFFTITM